MKTKEQRIDFNRKIIILAIIILASSLLRWFYINEPVFWNAGWALIRPVHTAILTEDLYQKNFNILKTELNSEGAKAVYLQEFPLYDLVAALMFPVFGENIKTAVGVSIFLYAAALVFLFLFLREYTGDWGAIGAVFIAAFAPPTITICRMVQQTSLNVLLIFANLYFFRRFLDKPSWKRFFTSAFVFTLHILVMSIFLVFGLVMLTMLLSRKGIEPLKWAKTWLLAAIPVIICLLWYAYAMSVTRITFPKEYAIIYYSKIVINPADLISVWKIISHRVISYLSLPGLLISLAGLYIIRKNKLAFIIFAYLTAWLLFSIPYSHSLKVHIHYLPYYATIFVAPCVEFFRFIKGKVSLPFYTTLLVISFIFFFWHIFYIVNTEFKVQPVEFIRPVAKRINSVTEKESRILFLGYNTGLWRREWEYATGRLGFHNKADAPYDSLKKYIGGRFKPDYAAVLPWKYTLGRNPVEPEKSVRRRLFDEYPLRDSFLGEYLLFDLRVPSSKLIEQPGFVKRDLKFKNSIVLIGFIERPFKNRRECTFLWKKEKKLKGDLYFIAVKGNVKISSLSHRIMSYALPVSHWQKDGFYAETVFLAEKDSINVEPSDEFYIYDKSSQEIFASESTELNPAAERRLSAAATGFFSREGVTLLKEAGLLGILGYTNMNTQPFK